LAAKKLHDLEPAPGKLISLKDESLVSADKELSGHIFSAGHRICSLLFDPEKLELYP
jgi:hypothetical protein